MVSYIIYLFTTPSAYLRSVKGFLANQMGHWAIGVVMAYVMGWATLALYAVWEFAQYRFAVRSGKDLRADAVSDWSFVATGVMAVLVSPWVLILTGAKLIEGVFERLSK